MKTAQRPENFLGYNATGHKGLELEEDSEFYLVFSNFPQRASFNLMK